MPRYGWAGPGDVHELTLARARVPTLTEPSDPGEDTEMMQLWKCKVCGKKFAKPMIVARHFNSSHEDQRIDAESWREFSEEIWVESHSK